MNQPNGRIVTVGLSGSSSAGKTTLTAMLTLVLPPDKLLLLHADDFGKEFDDLPELYGEGSAVLDADSRDSVYFDRLWEAFEFAVHNKRLPPTYEVHDFIRNDLQNAAAKFDSRLIDDMQRIVRAHNIQWDLIDKILVVDGFLLYHDQALRSKLDVKLLLRTSKNVARLRRFGRYDEGIEPEGSEQFWKTKSYFEDAVWPNYVKEHAFLFPRGDVEATVDPNAMQQEWQISTPPNPDVSLGETLEWGISTLLHGIQSTAGQTHS